MGRWEAPLPVAETCNAKCLGCLNSQEPDSPLSAVMDRIPFTPSAEEIGLHAASLSVSFFVAIANFLHS